MLRRPLPAVDRSKKIVDVKVIECGDSLDFIPQGRTFEDIMRDGDLGGESPPADVD
jgi:hypothetical protein